MPKPMLAKFTSMILCAKGLNTGEPERRAFRFCSTMLCSQKMIVHIFMRKAQKVVLFLINLLTPVGMCVFECKGKVATLAIKFLSSLKRSSPYEGSKTALV